MLHVPINKQTQDASFAEVCAGWLRDAVKPKHAECVASAYRIMEGGCRLRVKRIVYISVFILMMIMMGMMNYWVRDSVIAIRGRFSLYSDSLEREVPLSSRPLSVLP